MKCEKCGTELPMGNTVCQNCGHTNRFPAQPEKTRFLPSFILGLAASLFGIGGGLCMTMCSSLYSSGMAPFILILGGSVVGLIGACKCLSKAFLGSILQLVAAVMIIICAYGITGSEFATIIAMVLFIISGVIGVVYSLVSRKK